MIVNSTLTYKTFCDIGPRPGYGKVQDGREDKTMHNSKKIKYLLACQIKKQTMAAYTAEIIKDKCMYMYH